jgi:hypothetical protein
MIFYSSIVQVQVRSARICVLFFPPKIGGSVFPKIGHFGGIITDFFKVKIDASVADKKKLKFSPTFRDLI